MSLGREIEDAQRVYKDILNGYSTVLYQGETLYVKHLSDLDHGEIQEYKKISYKEAKKKGVLTEDEQIKSLVDQELWDDKKEERISHLRDELSSLSTTRRKLILKKQIASVKKEMKVLEDELVALLTEKEELMGITCESYSEKKLNERYVYHCLYKDAKIEERFLSEEEFEELDASELSSLIKVNNEKLLELSSDNIEKIAACPFFLNSLMLCKSSPFIYFGKPVVELTNFQQTLFSTGTRFRSVMEGSGKVPPDMTSLGKMVDWYTNTIPTSGGGGGGGGTEDGAAGQTLFGADKEELKALTARKDDGRAVKDLDKEAQSLLKEGGKEKKYLDMNDMLKLHGEI